MPARKLVQPPPQVFVLHRFLVRGAPAAALPRMDPLADSLLHVLRVGIDAHAAAPLERFERANDRGKLHAVVRRSGLAAENLPLRSASAQHDAPPAGPGVAAARAVGIDLDRGVTS